VRLAETPAGASCEKADLETFEPGTLTIGTDKPAFPPYFVDDDPTNGEGFESAVAYAIARELGFSESEVKWTVVPFNASYRPGPKDFDFDVNQISITPQRAHRVDARERGRELLARFGLGGREDEHPDRLSGGQQQRVAIVRALATAPRALLLDEVTSALDPELVGEVLAVIRDLKADGMTMLIATHEMAFARDVADEVCFLHDGRVLERGSAEQVLSAPQQPETQRFLRRLLEAR
jgi:ABC-type dipeptide/oligopeptide/nickel transport system ATPase subunit